MEVSGSQQTLGEGNNTATLLYSTSSTTSTTSDAIGSATGPSKVTIVVDNNVENTGYITATGAVRIYNIEITYATGSGSGTTPTDATWSINPAEMSVKAGETAIATVTTNYDGTLTAKSNDETIATASYANGMLTVNGVKGGNTVITLSGIATSKYNAIEKTIDVVVTAETEEPEPIVPLTGTFYYKKITSIDEIVDGGVFVVVNETNKKAMGQINSSNHGDGIDIEEVKGSKDIYSIASENTESNPYEISIEKIADDTYTLKTLQGYIGVGNKTDLASSTSSTDTKFQWGISFSDQDNVEILNKNQTTRYIKMYATNGDFRAYTSSNGVVVQLYRKVGQFIAAEVVDNYATFYSKDYAYEMPAGVTGYAVTVDAATGKLNKIKAYAAGAEVPAATPLLLKAPAAGTYYPAVLNKTVNASYTGANDMEGDRDANDMTKSGKEGEVNYYKLAVGSAGAGFYWGAEDGAAFKMVKPTTAYLSVSAAQAQGVRGFAFADSEATGIGEIAAGVQGEEAIYTLAGVRVRAAKSELPAGVYVANGKKFMVK